MELVAAIRTEVSKMFDLVTLGTSHLQNRDKRYAEMCVEIHKNLPMLKDGIAQFGKAQSQFMDNFLTVSHPTPLRNARQILAEINKSLEALKEAQYKISKRKLSVKRMEKKLETETDPLNLEELKLDIAFEKTQIDTTMVYVEGAIRQITNYIEQYQLILKNAGVTKLTEEIFEAEEEAYHIMKAFDQAINSARARGGLIDEGNHGYFSQIGVNGKMAELFIQRFFQQELEHIQRGEKIGHEFLSDFLDHMREEFKGCSKKVSERKGNVSLTDRALLRSA